MPPKRTGLGRGIGSLIPTSDAAARPVDVFFPTGGSGDQSGATNDGEGAQLVAVPGARLADLPVDAIVPNAQQPRSEFDRDALDELVASIREVGVLQPVVVRPIAGQDGRYELVMGERRLRATKEVGLATIPAIVKDTADDAMLRDALLENLHRSELNPLEEASAYQQLLADFGITQEELAGRIGRSRPQISNTLRLLRLPAAVQTRVAAGVLSAGHARAVLAAGDADAMQRLADKIVNEDLSVRAAEAVVARGPRTPRRLPPSAGGRQSHLDEIAERLGDRLSTRVSVALGRKKGQITIDFATVSDLNRILAELGEDGFSR